MTSGVSDVGDVPSKKRKTVHVMCRPMDEADWLEGTTPLEQM